MVHPQVLQTAEQVPRTICNRKRHQTMTLVRTLTIASALLITGSLALATQAAAGGIFDRRGSIKDSRPFYGHRTKAKCYFQVGAGYSMGFDGDATYSDNANGNTFDVTNLDADDTWLGEVAVGCKGHTTGRGFRYDMAYTYRAPRDYSGNVDFLNLDQTGGPFTGTNMNTEIRSQTLMFNVYYDLGNWRNLTPYVMGGIGASYNTIDTIHLPGAVGLSDITHRRSDWSFAWTLGAGLQYKMSERAALDFGYRYVNFGSVKSIDTGCCVPFKFKDLDAMEFRVGLRYYFGGPRHVSHK